jgi:phosphopantetheinyl transferase
VLTSASFKFNASHTGDMCVVFGTNVGGAGVNYMLARLTYASPTTCTMTDPATGATLNAQAGASAAT